MVVGWYHSHPGFGCWLSGVDIQTQQSFEQLSKRAVAVVIDPIQSVKGKVVIDAFRTINIQAFGQPPRQTTSNLGHLKKPSIQALIHNLNRNYYSINISYRKDELEQKMLSNLHKKRFVFVWPLDPGFGMRTERLTLSFVLCVNSWNHGLKPIDAETHAHKNESSMKNFLDLVKQYNKRLEEEETKTAEEIIVANVGKIDPKKHLENDVEELITDNVVQSLATMIATIVF